MNFTYTATEIILKFIAQTRYTHKNEKRERIQYKLNFINDKRQLKLIAVYSDEMK